MISSRLAGKDIVYLHGHVLNNGKCVVLGKRWLRGYRRSTKKDVFVDLSILVQTWPSSTVCQLDKQILLVVEKFKNDLMSVERKYPSARKDMLSKVFCYTVQFTVGDSVPAGATGYSLIWLRSRKLQRKSSGIFVSTLTSSNTGHLSEPQNCRADAVLFHCM